MKTRPSRIHQAGFTLVELLIGSTVGALVGLGVFAFIDTGSMLTARNLSVNLTSNSMRGSLDRLESLIQQADTQPRLINTTGASVATPGPAAGIRFDYFVGGPVVANPGTLTLASSASTFTLRYALASSRHPQAGDIVRFDGTATTLRPRISSVATPTLVSAGMYDIAVTLTGTLGTAVTSTTGLRAKVVRDIAVIVMASGNIRELRYYPDMVAATDLNDASMYRVLTDQIAMQSADATPFSTITISSREFINLSLRLRASNFDRRLVGRQADEFNTFAQVNSFIRPKTNP
jgi:prepilin-type N-terminal cleavage/methylation domain-containing protein